MHVIYEEEKYLITHVSNLKWKMKNDPYHLVRLRVAVRHKKDSNLPFKEAACFTGMVVLSISLSLAVLRSTGGCPNIPRECTCFAAIPCREFSSTQTSVLYQVTREYFLAAHLAGYPMEETPIEETVKTLIYE